MITYDALAARFDVHYKDPRGMEYLTGNQVVGRLNEVLGPHGWTFVVREHGFDEESDEVWVLGSLTATIDGVATMREQFGSQKHNRFQRTGKIIDYGFDLKGATTDALKKCATLIGVGLYLSEKEGGIEQKPVETKAPVTKASPVVDAVNDVNDPEYQLYVDLCERAQKVEVEWENLTLGVSRDRLRSAAKALHARLKQQAKQAA